MMRPVTSPAARRPETFVHPNPSTTTAARSILSPSRSRPRPSIAGTRPTATSASSASTVFPPESSAATPDSVTVSFSIFVPVSTFALRRMSARSISFDTSASESAKSDGSISTSVTFAPSSVQSDANSQPMYPPPTTMAEAGSFVRASASSLVITRLPSNGNAFGRAGSLPVATRTCRPWMRETDPSAAATSTSPGSITRARPGITATFADFSSISTPRPRRSTIWSLRAAAWA